MDQVSDGFFVRKTEGGMGERVVGLAIRLELAGTFGVFGTSEGGASSLV